MSTCHSLDTQHFKVGLALCYSDTYCMPELSTYISLLLSIRAAISACTLWRGAGPFQQRPMPGSCLSQKLNLLLERVVHHAQCKECRAWTFGPQPTWHRWF
mmetsp:Transcript_16800/g.29493  ORF Transcript_16800/g.29493 Transcript_16800/m.29493 type:complete len:101 (+) Transcript_16800:125-427(+)